MKYYWILILTLCFSCQSQIPDRINLETIDNSFDVQSFYQKKIKSTNKILDVKGIDQFKTDTLNYYKNNNNFGESDLEISPKNGFWTSSQEPIKRFGYEYSTEIFSPKDTLAVYQNIIFPSIDMIENVKGEFIGLVAKKDYYNELELEIRELDQLKTFLTKLNGKYIEQKSGSQIGYSWQTKNSLIHIILIKQSGIAKDSKLLFFKVSKDYLNDVKLFTEGHWTVLQNY